MKKEKIVVCIEDEEYQSRFVKCMMNHYKDRYEIYVVDEVTELEVLYGDEKNIVIISDRKTLPEDLQEKAKVLLLKEDMVEEVSSESEGIQYTSKYQEVYKIVERIEMMSEKSIGKAYGKKGKKGVSMIGVFSLEKEAMQLPFSVLLAETYGDKGAVLLMDLQPYSGLSMGQSELDTPFGLEDLISVASTELYTTNRLMASIGHEQRWDYIFPAKNASYLSEVDGDVYQKIIRILFSEKGYEYVIVNFGASFSGMYEFMEQCEQFYLLKARGDSCSWREKAFLEELRRQGKEEFLRKIKWIDMPKEGIRENSWNQLAKTWLWSELGDQVREQNWAVSNNAEFV